MIWGDEDEDDKEVQESEENEEVEKNEESKNQKELENKSQRSPKQKIITLIKDKYHSIKNACLASRAVIISLTFIF